MSEDATTGGASPDVSAKPTPTNPAPAGTPGPAPAGTPGPAPAGTPGPAPAGMAGRNAKADEVRLRRAILAARDGREGLKRLLTDVQAATARLQPILRASADAPEKGPVSPSAATEIAGRIADAMGLLAATRLGDVPAFDGSHAFRITGETRAVGLDELNQCGERPVDWPHPGFGAGGSDGDAATGDDPQAKTCRSGEGVTGFGAITICPPAGQDASVFHARTHAPTTSAGCLLVPGNHESPDDSNGPDASVAAVLRVVGLPMPSSEVIGRLEARLVEMPLPGPPLGREGLSVLRRALWPLGIRVIRRRGALRLLALRPGAGGRFKIVVAGPAGDAWSVENEQAGQDGQVRVNGRPAQVAAGRATFRHGGEHLHFALGGPLAQRGGEIVVRVAGGWQLPIEQRQNARATDFNATRLVPIGWPEGRNVAAGPLGRLPRLNLPRLDAHTLGLPRASLASVCRAAEAGTPLRRTPDVAAAALRQLAAIEVRLRDAIGTIESALQTVTQELQARASAGEASAACDANAAPRRSAA